MPPGFGPGQGTHASHYPELRFEMTQSGRDFFQTAIDTTPQGEERTSAKIALVHGAGKGDDVYFTWHDDGLYELPVAGLYPLKKWGNAPVNRYLKGDFSRPTTPRCLECHTTWFEHVAGTANQYRRENFILGVTCERCHGPGRAHVAFRQTHPKAGAADAIVRPDRLTRELQLDVCTQCHSNANKRRGPAFSYRPGVPLEEHFRTALSKFPEEDHVANQVKYLRQSQCFEKSDTLTCTTCHNPHRPVDAGMVHRACLKCHQTVDCAEQERLPAAVRSNCVGCHMPQRVWMNVHFHTADDQFVPPIRRHEHQIGIHPEARDEVLLDWHRTQTGDSSRAEVARLAPALVEYWLAEAASRRREYRFLAEIGAIREALRFDSGPAVRDKLREAVAIQTRLNDHMTEAVHQIEQNRLAEAIEILHKALAIKPTEALAHAKLGTCYAMTGQDEQAVEHWQAAIQHDPDNPYGHSMLGWTAYLQDRAADAVESYRRADAIEPFNAQINYQWGLSLVKLGQFPDALQHFQQVLTIDPKHAGGCQGVSQMLRGQGRPDEALRFAKRAVHLTRFQNSDMLVTLADSYADAGRFSEARDSAAQALEVAQSKAPALVPQIRRRLDELRTRAAQTPK